MILSPSENRQIDSLVETVLVCLELLAEQCEYSKDYKTGIRHTIQQLVGVKVSEIVLADSIDLDSVVNYLSIETHVDSFSTPHTIERNNRIRVEVKNQILEYLNYIDENL